jgi:hypothetical protein
MLTKPFGWTGVPVSVIGQGTWMIEGSREAERRAVEALRLGLDLGMTHIDTAEMYGNGRAEELVGEAIAGRRHEVFLVSKVLPSNASYQGTLRACERSLRRLRTDYLDLYLLHWRGSHTLEETMGAMEALVAAGKIRYLGVSNFDVEDLKAAERCLTTQRLAANQVLYHLKDRGIQRRLIPYCAERGIAVVDTVLLLIPTSRAGKPGGKTLVRNRRPRWPHGPASNPQFPDAAAERIHDSKSLTPGSRPGKQRRNRLGFHAEELVKLEQAFPTPTRDTPLGMLLMLMKLFDRSSRPEGGLDGDSIKWDS